MKDIYTYQIGKNLYINLTNRCTNRCTFCVRNGKETYEGYPLWLKEGEPTVEQVISGIGDPKNYDEVVFCGFGEPTYRLDAMLKICDYVHENGGRTRVNTNGHGALIADMGIAEKLKGKLDGVNISLNASSKEKYDALCRPKIEGAFEGLLAFARDCKRCGVNAWFSVVDCIGEEEVAACARLAKEIGLPLRVRPMIE